MLQCVRVPVCDATPFYTTAIYYLYADSSQASHHVIKCGVQRATDFSSMCTSIVTLEGCNAYQCHQTKDLLAGIAYNGLVF
jgi:hypothetical protein